MATLRPDSAAGDDDPPEPPPPQPSSPTAAVAANARRAALPEPIVKSPVFLNIMGRWLPSLPVIYTGGHGMQLFEIVRAFMILRRFPWVLVVSAPRALAIALAPLSVPSPQLAYRLK